MDLSQVFDREIELDGSPIDGRVNAETNEFEIHCRTQKSVLRDQRKKNRVLDPSLPVESALLVALMTQQQKKLTSLLSASLPIASL
jgi:hypothetical protein